MNDSEIAKEEGSEIFEHFLNQITSTTTTTITTTSTTLFNSIQTTNSPLLNKIIPSNNKLNINIIAYCYIMPTICVLGIIGNSMNVVTLASPRLKAVSYMYLRALAVSDLLCMLFVLAFACCEVLKESGIPIEQNPLYGFYQAHVMLSFINWALATGVYIVVALSLERYVSVVFPLHFRIWNSPKRAMKAIIIAYTIPALFYIPYGIARYSVNEKINSKGEVIYGAIDSEISKTFGWQVYKWTREAFLRFLPILILFVLNFQIMIAFRKRQKMFDRLRNRESIKGTARDDTLLYILGGIAVMFFVCNIPAAINLLFINEIVKKRPDYQIFRAAANLLEITNHAAQFYIFCVCSSDYRVTFMQKFPCLRAYYVNKSKLCSFLRSASQLPKRSTARRTISTTTNSKQGNFVNISGTMRRSVSASNTPFSVKNEKQNGKFTKKGGGGGGPISEMTFVRSTTITGELVSTCGGRNTEQETIDIQIASLESLSDESETLLKQQKPQQGWVNPISTKLCFVGLTDDEEEGIICRRSSNVEGIVEDELTDKTDGTSYL
ncbi:G_PROTEIN_RECEP_F1_2 domain-containing protein [Meloidogyne graminicola]|uniref:G_PROTEIN_RECEP_F1_2 domain-containing protein n=1 Tax=Meloidogyne graminicola TaxID=189291 RepID=A0A8T0A089_9BILA|nr:G_PROTEIN_RECEP_F1_2 domain-containing protein [Meloidogyne graminicola]